MAEIFKWEGGPSDSEATVSGTVNLAATDISGRPTSPSVRVTSTAGAAFVRFPFVATPTFGTRFYFKTPTSWGGSACNIFVLRVSSSLSVVNLAISGTGAPGQFRVVLPSGTTIANTPTNYLKTDTWYGVIFYHNGSSATGTIDVEIWEYGLRASTSRFLTASNAELGSTTSVMADYGRVNSNPALPSDLYYDSFVGVDTDNGLGAHSEEPIEPEEPDEPEAEYPVYFQDESDFDLPRPFTMPSTDLSGSVIEGEFGDVIQVDQAAGASPHLHWEFADQDTVSLSSYFYHTGWGSASVALMTIGNGSTPVASIVIGGTGQPGNVRLTTSGGTVVINGPSGTIETGRWYRFVLMYDRVGSRALASVYRIDDWSGPIWTTGWVVHSGFEAKANYIKIGRVNTTPTMPRFYIRNIKGKFNNVIMPAESTTDTELWAVRTASGWYKCDVVGIKGTGSRIHRRVQV